MKENVSYTLQSVSIISVSYTHLVIEKEAVMKANKIINSANSQYDNIRQKCLQLIQQYNQFKMQFKQIAVKQIDLLDSDFYEIYTNDLTQSLNEAIDNSKKEDKVKASDEVKPQNTKETAEEAESTPCLLYTSRCV